MRIAIDYDGTYTADPALWLAFMELAKSHGHQVTCVTMRYPNEPIPEKLPIGVVYTSRKAKAAFYPSDIWIEDKPYWLLNDSQ